MHPGDKKKTILLVEDEALIAMDERIILEREGFNVLTANTGERALEMVRAHPEMDLVLMDINLGPGIDGSEAAAIILGEHDLPVVFLSSHTDPEVVEKAEAVTSYGYVVKSSGETVILASIRMAFRLFEARTREKESEEKFRNLFQKHSAVKLLIDPASGDIVDANEAAEKFYGWPHGKLTRMRIQDVNIHPPEEIAAGMMKAGRGERAHLEFRHRLADGSIRDVAVYSSGIDIQGRTLLHSIIHDITERKRAEEALFRSEERYRGTLENMLEGCQIIGFDWRYIFINDAAERHNRRPKGELLGRRYMDMWPGIEHTEVFERIHRCLIDRIPSRMENKFVFPDGGDGWFELFIQPVNEGVFILSMDITERVRAESDIRESERRFRSIVEGAPDPIFIQTAGTFAYLNPAACRLFGIAAPEVLMGTPVPERVHPASRDMVRERIRRLNEERLPVEELMEHRFLRIDGSEVWVETKGEPIVYGGKNGALVFVRDVTQRREADEALQSSLREKTRLIAELYHRTKNNMQVIMSMLMLKAGYMDDGPVKNMVRDTVGRIQAMALVHERLLRSRSLSRIDLDEYIRDLTKMEVSLYNVASGRIGLILDMEPVPVLIDIAAPCGLVVNELVVNAFKHAFPDGRNGEVSIRLRRNGDREGVVLIVSDNGVGIPGGYDYRGGTSYGFQTIVAIVEHQLQGAIEFEGENGFTCRMRFRDSLYEERV